MGRKLCVESSCAWTAEFRTMGENESSSISSRFIYGGIFVERMRTIAQVTLTISLHFNVISSYNVQRKFCRRIYLRQERLEWLVLIFCESFHHRHLILYLEFPSGLWSQEGTQNVNSQETNELFYELRNNASVRYFIELILRDVETSNKKTRDYYGEYTFWQDNYWTNEQEFLYGETLIIALLLCCA